MGLLTEMRARIRRAQKKGATTEERIAGVEGVLADFRRQRSAAQAAISSAASRRRGLLLQDAPDEQIAELDVETDRQHLAL